ncbi:hypothetical protein DO97_07120 [Neosynechococcus sphagnicola sy1]|uniref:Urease accessory protein UreJ n=1 Tax=Neosynechococcus sphagnicola sy1 TaxID=1497020 RepID=A0A098TK26_9CYAN|nr:hypothetical protein DO97_07120 [Neosynechococcus sphagnicola sy1]
MREPQSWKQRQLRAIAIIAGVSLSLSNAAHQAQAHHAMGGGLPATAWEGLLSGLAHPVIGLDHLAFVVAIGLLAAGRHWGALIPAAFVGAAMVGTGLHLGSLDLPGAEIAISLSVLLLGLILIWNQQLNFALITGIAAIAGVFHGYAYGESIVGAEITPLVAYLVGFTLIQAAIALSALGVGQLLAEKAAQSLMQLRRISGYAFALVGIAFLATALA